MAEDFFPFVENRQDFSDTEIADPTTSARIAIYDDMVMPPRVVMVEPSDIRTYLAEITKTVYELVIPHCDVWSFQVIRELVENLIHASFAEPTISILDKGKTIAVCDQGPGIPNKTAALKPSFSSATSPMKRFIRGVGSGLPIVEEWIKLHHGTLTIEDNLGRGTTVTVSLVQADSPEISSPQQGSTPTTNPMVAQGQMPAQSANPAAAGQTVMNPAAMNPGAGQYAAPYGNPYAYGNPYGYGNAYGGYYANPYAGVQGAPGPVGSYTPNPGAPGYAGYPSYQGYPVYQGYPGSAYPGSGHPAQQQANGWGSTGSQFGTQPPYGQAAYGQAPYGQLGVQSTDNEGGPQHGGQPNPYQSAPAGKPTSAGLPAETPEVAESGIDAHAPLTKDQKDILLLFSNLDKIGPKELNEQLGISAPTASRKLREISEAGFIIKKGAKYILTGEGSRMFSYLSSDGR